MQNEILGPKFINYLLGPRQKVTRNSHIAHNRTIHLCQVSASGYFLVSTLPRRNSNVLLAQDAIGHFFLEGGGGWEFGNNNFSKKRQTELTFRPQLVLIVVQRHFEKIEFLKLPNILSFWSKFDPKLPPENGQNQKLENFLIISKGKIFIADRKNLYIVNYL